MSDIIYLYLKTHNQTGLKYIGKTAKDPFKYQGSGKYWKHHIDKHGCDITTEILFSTDSKDALKLAGIYYSELWNIVESPKFANLMIETGSGGDNSQNIDYVRLGLVKQGKTWNLSEKAKQKHRISAQRYWDSNRSDVVREIRYNGSLKEFKDNLYGPPCPGWIRNNRIQQECPRCGKRGDNRNMKRWHFDNCKHK